jgi:ferrochelatase
MSKTAVVLMNLGGPDSAASVEPFLFNLFYDPAIIALPNPLRWLVAKLIARRRGPVARAIYAKIGNESPLLRNTQAQAQALEAELGQDCRVFVTMRYWAPRADEVAAAVKQWGAAEVILLPLYPQFSSTTSASSTKEWERAAAAVGLNAPTRTICCYPTEAGFIAALAENIAAALAAWPKNLSPPRLLLSAHGLPKRTVARGDPYEAQITQTASQLRQILNRSAADSIVCYQSRVGPLDWLGPATDAEIRRAGQEKRGLIVAPIAFVSEHSETLVELDIEYRHIAEASGVPHYVRVPAIGAAPRFIAGLASLVRQARDARDDRPLPDGGKSHCPGSFAFCPLQKMR